MLNMIGNEYVAIINEVLNIISLWILFLDVFKKKLQSEVLSMK